MSDESDGLPSLTDKQLKFVEGIQKGLSKSDAYRQAYDTSRMKQATVWRSAAETASKPKVAAWLDYIKRESLSKLLDETTYDLKAHIAELNDAIQFAREHNAAGPALNGVISKGRACNHYVEHKQISIEDTRRDRDMLLEIQQLLGKQAMEDAAKNLGYDTDSILNMDTIGPEQ